MRHVKEVIKKVISINSQSIMLKEKLDSSQKLDMAIV
jgi:hypothetical protein